MGLRPFGASRISAIRAPLILSTAKKWGQSPFFTVLALFLISHPLVSVAEGVTPELQARPVAGGDCIFQDGFECPPIPPGLSAAGSVLDYWTLSPVPAVLVISLSPPLIDIANEVGEYILEEFDPFSSFIIKGFRAPGYRETNNVEAMIDDQSLVLDIYIGAEPDLARQFASVGILQQAGSAIVIAEMRDTGGSPLEGVPLADVVLRDDLMVAIGDGPYYFGITGDLVDPVELNISTAFMGRGARVAFLNVPAGPATLSISLASPQPSISEELVVEHDVVHLLVAQ